MSNYKNRFNLRALNFQRQYPDLKWQHCCILAYFYTKADFQADQKKAQERLASQDAGFWSMIIQGGLSGIGMQDVENYMLEVISSAMNEDDYYDDGYNAQKQLR